MPLIYKAGEWGRVARARGRASEHTMNPFLAPNAGVSRTGWTASDQANGHHSSHYVSPRDEHWEGSASAAEGKAASMRADNGERIGVDRCAEITPFPPADLHNITTSS